MNNKKRWIAALLCLLMIAALAGCGETAVSQSEIFAMDTVMWLTAYGKNREAGLSAAEGVIRSMDSMLDPELETSITYAINHANGETVSIPGQVAKMISTAQEVYSRSNGALDLTIYPLVIAWGFYGRSDTKPNRVPSEDEIYACLRQRCFDEVDLRSFPNGSHTVSLPAGGQMTFASVAKGCAASYAIDAMRNAGVTSGIISLGGNVQTLGVKPDGKLWRVAITDPNNTASSIGTVDVGEMAIVTSGPYQRNFTDAYGRFYHHILRPNTGYPVSNSLASVTILCQDGTLADCLSTAMFVLGETAAINYWRTYGGFDMILITNDNRIVCTSGLIENFSLTNSYYKVSYTE